VDILSKLTHPNIVHLVSFFDEPTQYLIAMEFLEGGELFDRIVKKAYYNEKEARDLAFIMLSAIKYIHDRNIVHRDLKPENLLLKSQSDDADIKLADFGFAIIAEGDNLTEQCGTPGYVAPEILGHRPYGKSVDMWSVGVIIYILLGGYPPFHDENQRNLFKKIQAAKYEFHPDFWVPTSLHALYVPTTAYTTDLLTYRARCRTRRRT
jgi:serine/threonine protein kinase